MFSVPVKVNVNSLILGACRDPTMVGVVGQHCIVLGFEKRKAHMVECNEQKLYKLFNNMAVGYAGVKTDAEILIGEALKDCERLLSMNVVVNVEHLANFISSMKQKYLNDSTYRPFGVLCLIAGFDENGMPFLFGSEPSGTCEKRGNKAFGRYFAIVDDYLKRNYELSKVATVEDTVKMALKSLLQVGGLEKIRFEITVIQETAIKDLEEAEIIKIVNEIAEEQKNSQESK